MITWLFSWLQFDCAVRTTPKGSSQRQALASKWVFSESFSASMLKWKVLTPLRQWITFGSGCGTSESCITGFSLFFIPAASKTPRSPRPPYVFLRVGEVVMERNGHMIGVVVSWDPEMRAPPQWVNRLFSNSEVRSHNATHYYCYLKILYLYLFFSLFFNFEFHKLSVGMDIL